MHTSVKDVDWKRDTAQEIHILMAALATEMLTGAGERFISQHIFVLVTRPSSWVKIPFPESLLNKTKILHFIQIRSRRISSFQLDGCTRWRQGRPASWWRWWWFYYTRNRCPTLDDFAFRSRRFSLRARVVAEWPMMPNISTWQLHPTRPPVPGTTGWKEVKQGVGRSTLMSHIQSAALNFTSSEVRNWQSISKFVKYVRHDIGSDRVRWVASWNGSINGGIHSFTAPNHSRSNVRWKTYLTGDTFRKGRGKHRRKLCAPHMYGPILVGRLFTPQILLSCINILWIPIRYLLWLFFCVVCKFVRVSVSVCVCPTWLPSLCSLPPETAQERR